MLRHRTLHCPLGVDRQREHGSLTARHEPGGGCTLECLAQAKTWAMMRPHVLALADALTAALVKQFPDKF